MKQNEVKEYLDFLEERDVLLKERSKGLTITEVSLIVAKHSKSQLATLIYTYLKEMLISSRQLQGIPDEAVCVLNITQEDIAHELNITRQSVSNQLKVLEEANLVVLHSGGIKLNA